MPFYSYRTLAGRVIHEQFTMAHQPSIVLTDDGWPAYRSMPDDWSHRAFDETSTKSHRGQWPMESEACGVAPEQIPEAMAADRAAGVPCEYNSVTGAIKWDSPSHRKKWCEANEYYDRNSYGTSKEARRR